MRSGRPGTGVAPTGTAVDDLARRLRDGRRPRLVTISVPPILLAVAATCVAVWLSTVISALAGLALAPRRARRVTETRLADALQIGAVVQRWMRTPERLGGRAGTEGATFDRIGLRADPLSPHVRRTESGRFRLLPVPGRRGATLVLGWGHGTADAVAVLVVDALVQVPLPTIPWAWVRAQLQPPTAPAARARLPEPEAPPPRRRQSGGRPPTRPARSRPPQPPVRRLPKRPLWHPQTDGDRAPPDASRGSPPGPVSASSSTPSSPIRLPTCSPPAVLREPLRRPSICRAALVVPGRPARPRGAGAPARRA